MKPELSKKQREAVTLECGPAMILAGPGSGKTTVILERLRHLIYHMNVLPEQILVITYTKAAAIEMKRRGQNLLADAENMPVFATFHSYFYSVLKHSYEYQHFSLSTEQQRLHTLKNLIELHYEHIKVSQQFLRDILSCISKYKNQMDISNDIVKMGFSEKEFLFLFDTYVYFQIEQKLMDYDDILLFSYQLFQKNPKKCDEFRRQFFHILVDEFQDVNKIQYDLLYLLSGKNGNIFVVGDDDQSIYRFRGAGEENLRRFEQDFGKVYKIILDKNYRCPKKIVQLSQKFISHNTKRFDKEFVSGKEEKGQIICNVFESKDEEIHYLIKMVKKAISDKQGTFAILTRTNRQLSFLAEMLRKEKIPFYKKEKIVPFYENTYVKTIIGYLLFACKKDTGRKVLFTFLNEPVRFLKRESFLEWDEGDRILCNVNVETLGEKRSLEKLDKVLKTLGKLPPRMAVSYILKVVGYEEYVRKKCKTKKEAEDFADCMNELLERAGMYDNLLEWLSYVEWDETNEEKDVLYETIEETSKVFLYTFHASKGLEFEHVFLPGINAGAVPYGRKLSLEELEEERRMFYVALTRASSSLYVSYVEGGTKKDTASPFLKECGFTVSKI